ncbi:MAG: RHS repeat-associated core domain-containing protein [Saprospiraceae bacterium]|nr:RHS repeat-associated core domain-containing protein [Saprospiraceae bacterium]
MPERLPSNRVKKITDTAPSSYKKYGFEENGADYLYDGNGNITRDPNKEADLAYNHLNKLNSIKAMDGSWSINFFYDALGNMHEKIVAQEDSITRQRDYFNQVELINGFVDFVQHANGYVNIMYAVPEELILSGVESGGTATYEAVRIYSSRQTSGTQNITLRAGSIELGPAYAHDINSTTSLEIQQYVPNGLEYVYAVRDHLGTNRLFFKGNSSLINSSHIVSVHANYPFGMDLRQPNNVNKDYAYRYNGKEELELTGYRNFGFRCLDPSICRWTSTDPLAAAYSQLTPYAYVGNMPAKYIDPDGRQLFLAGTNKEQEIKDILSLINNAKFEGKVKLTFSNTSDGTRVDADFGGVSDDAIANDAGLSLVSDLVNSEKKFLFEVAGSFGGIDRETGNATADLKFAVGKHGSNPVAANLSSTDRGDKGHLQEL